MQLYFSYKDNFYPHFTVVVIIIILLFFFEPYFPIFLTNSTELSRWQTTSRSAGHEISQNFMEPEGSLCVP
jgi:hypothetical protein